MREAGEVAAEDLTARARIRGAALLTFAERGVKGATIRGIAKAAGVSPGLVQHHFGSKEALRRECDEFAIETLRRTNREALAGGLGDPGFLAVAVRTALPVQRYVARALADGSPAAAELFDDVLAVTEETLAGDGPGVRAPATGDVRGYAAAMTAMRLGMLVLHEHLDRALGASPLSVEGYPRLALALLDILDDRLMEPETVARAREALNRMSGPSGRVPGSVSR